MRPWVLPLSVAIYWGTMAVIRSCAVASDIYVAFNFSLFCARIENIRWFIVELLEMIVFSSTVSKQTLDSNRLSGCLVFILFPFRNAHSFRQSQQIFKQTSNFKLKIYQISFDATVHAILSILSVLKPGKMDLLLLSLDNNV